MTNGLDIAKVVSEQMAGRGAPGDETVLIVDDCMLSRDNLATVVALDGRYVPITAWDLPSLVAALGGVKPGVALLNMASRDWRLLLKAVMDLNPTLRVIVLGASDDDESGIVACGEAGVAGYHMRTDSLDHLFTLIDTVTAGASGCPARVSAILLHRVSALASEPQPAVVEPALTAREAQILRMLELGQSNRDIAMQLSIAVHTVKNHVHSLLTKLGVGTRTEAAALSRATRMNQGPNARTRSRFIQS